jgi:hypothetical protein
MIRLQVRAFRWVPPLVQGLVRDRRQQMEIPKWST